MISGADPYRTVFDSGAGKKNEQPALGARGLLHSLPQSFAGASNHNSGTCVLNAFMSQSAPQKSRVSAYRDLAREALERVGEYNARAQWFELKGDAHVALEYRQLSQECLARAQRYKALAELAEKHS
jgi:hypothetical protein